MVIMTVMEDSLYLSRLQGKDTSPDLLELKDEESEDLEHFVDNSQKY
jgi:hypothetical protein